MKKRTVKKVTLLLAVLIVLLVGGCFGWRMLQKKGTLNNENYIASNFLDMGLYAKGRSTASQALAVSSNDASRQLILLSFCYEEDFENALAYGKKYLKKSDNGLTEEICQYAETALESGADDVSLIRLHDKVKEQLNVSSRSSEKLAAAKEILQQDDIYDVDRVSLTENLERLENENDVMSLKAKAYGSALQGDMEQAAAYAQQLVQKDNSLPNQMAVANAVVAASMQNHFYEEEADLQAVERAINYMKANKPWRDQAGYQLQLARLYFMLGDKDEAKGYINRTFSESQEEEMGYLGPEVAKLLSAYDTTSSEVYGIEEETQPMSIYEAAEALDYGITQGLTVSYYEEESFADFLVKAVQEYRSLLAISYVNAREFPEIEVHLSTSMEEDISLAAENLLVYEQGAQITDYELIRSGEADLNLSVCFVLDVSGSMEGEALVNAKSAAGNFLTMLEGSDSQVGLVKFCEEAEIVSYLTGSAGVLARGIDSLEAGGGTSIASGLEKGIEVLRNSPGTSVIILLSDGEDGDAERIGTVKTMLKNQGITVYSIGVGYADGEYLKEISDATGGVYLKAESSEDLGNIYRQISQYIFQDYVLRFTIIEEPENFERNVKIQWKQEAYDEARYTVGVSEEDILLEELMGIRTNFYEQTGGSGEEVTEDGQ